MNIAEKLMLAGTEKKVIVDPNADPHWSKVVFLSHFDGAPGATSATDQKGNTIVFNGASSLVANGQFGTAFNTNGLNANYLSINKTSAFTFAANDFTVEFSIFALGYPGVRGTVLAMGSGVNGFPIFALMPNSAVGMFSYNDNSEVIQSNAGIQIGSWRRIAFTRASGVMRVYVDGVKSGEVQTTNQNFFDQTGYVRINGLQAAGGRQFNGYVDEMRITNGVARYTSETYPIATSPFPNYGP